MEYCQNGDGCISCRARARCRLNRLFCVLVRRPFRTMRTKRPSRSSVRNVTHGQEPVRGTLCSFGLDKAPVIRTTNTVFSSRDSIQSNRMACPPGLSASVHSTKTVSTSPLRSRSSSCSSFSSLSMRWASSTASSMMCFMSGVYIILATFFTAKK